MPLGGYMAIFALRQCATVPSIRSRATFESEEEPILLPPDLALKRCFVDDLACETRNVPKASSLKTYHILGILTWTLTNGSARVF
ncbi:hypothetical protein S40293_10384 [Stachybotrys chartarum IBT 40293]|nr:hypothetical protein S40293_10384 [Stachybotrys chartarum IBT 40293]